MLREKIIAAIETTKARSAWSKGVKLYAIELVEYMTESELLEGVNDNMRRKALLNGADNWNQYSWDGCSLIYDRQIAERLCTPSELKKTRNGERRPNSHEEWLDTQARALYQAAIIAKRAWRDELAKLQQEI